MKFFYDLGANVGQTFDWYLRKGDFHQYHIVCFEPSPRHLTALVEKCRAMCVQFASVTLVSAAASDRPGLARFFEKVSPLGDSLLHEAGKNRDTGLALEVPAISLAQYIRDHTVPGDSVTLKVDIEGAEHRVLQDVLDHGPLDRIDRVLVEWHGAVNPTPLIAGFVAAGIPTERWLF